MRTAILFGCGMIADSINIHPGHSDIYNIFLSIVLLFCVIMDIIDFCRNNK